MFILVMLNEKIVGPVKVFAGLVDPRCLLVLNGASNILS